MKILHNPSNLSVVNYRITEIELDENEKPKLDNKGEPIQTGRTLEWTIASGETLEFPNYVADYLKDIYGFLEIKKEIPTAPVPVIEKVEEQSNQVQEETPPENPMVHEVGKIICKHCGQGFQKAVNLGLHIGSKHPEKLM